MKNEELLETLEQIAGRLMNYEPLGTKRPALLSQIDELKRTYACTEVQEKHREIYDSLVKKGQELQTHYRYSAKPAIISAIAAPPSATSPGKWTNCRSTTASF